MLHLSFIVGTRVAHFTFMGTLRIQRRLNGLSMWWSQSLKLQNPKVSSDALSSTILSIYITYQGKHSEISCLSPEYSYSDARDLLCIDPRSVLGGVYGASGASEVVRTSYSPCCYWRKMWTNSEVKTADQSNVWTWLGCYEFDWFKYRIDPVHLIPRVTQMEHCPWHIFVWEYM